MLDLHNSKAEILCRSTYQTDETAASALVPLSQIHSQKFEVDMFENQQQNSENHSRGEQNESAREVEDF